MLPIGSRRAEARRPAPLMIASNWRRQRAGRDEPEVGLPGHRRDPLVVLVGMDEGHAGSFRGRGDQEIRRTNTAVISVASNGELHRPCSAPHILRHRHGVEGAEAPC